MHHWTPGLVQPLAPVMVVSKTKLAGVLGAMIARIRTMVMYRHTLISPSKICRGSSSLVVKRLVTTGVASTAQPRSVPCHWCGTYFGTMTSRRP